VTSGALFGHFHNKSALLEIATDEVISRSKELIASALSVVARPASRLDTDPDRSLRQVVTQLVRAYRSPLPAALAELCVAARDDSRLAHALVAFNADVTVMVQDTLGAAIPQLTFDQSAEAVARLINSAAWASTAWAPQSRRLLREAQDTSGEVDLAPFARAIAILAAPYRNDEVATVRPSSSVARTLVSALLAQNRN
jgi:AcrR family transcriptional regulator